MRRWWSRSRAAWQAVWRGRQIESDVHDEMRLHIELHTERLVREQGLDREDARRRAHVAFGGIEKYRGAARDVRGLQWIDAISLDCRLAVRMLRKYPGLTLAGGFAMAVAIAIGATGFEVLVEVLNPALPVEGGDRVVAVQYATGIPGSPDRRVLREFAAWRQDITTIEDLGVYRTVQHNLVSRQAPPESITVAEMSASGFSVAKTPPLLGRFLLPDDEREDAPGVVVIGHHAWRSRFDADPDVVGRVVKIGGELSTIVGVMPHGFGFPVDHQFWVPMHVRRAAAEHAQGPELHVFGRLARGVTMRQAQAELTAVGERTATERDGPPERLRLVVLRYTHEALGITDPERAWALRIAMLLVGALAFVVAVNLAILMYARTVTRLGEIAVRTALGASRRRILAQLFIEAFILSLLGAGAGLLLSQLGLEQLQSLNPVVGSGGMPFWIDFDLSPITMIYAVALAAFAAVIMGVLPGLKATGRRLNANLRELNSFTGARLGWVWTTLVVVQIAVAVAVLPVAVYMAWHVVRMELARPGFAANSFVVGNVTIADRSTASNPNRVRARQAELTARLQGEPGVSAVTFSSSVPGFAGSKWVQFEDRADAERAGTPEVSTLSVATDLFETYGARMIAGRAFTSADVGAADAVVVNRSFAERLLGTRSALGVRFRYSGRTPQKSYQIVGVVHDFPGFPPSPLSSGEPTVYHAAAAGDIHPFVLSVRFNGSIPDQFESRFRALAAGVDPALQVRRVMPLTEFYDQLRAVWGYFAWAIGLVTLSVLLLSAAGIYALMSCTVAQRGREIAIRTALGAAPRRLVFSIFGRSARQLGYGVLGGSALSVLVLAKTSITLREGAQLLMTVAAVILAVGLLATIGPTRRCLRVQPSDILKGDT
jgi:putative ABC transport system permease protein